MQTKKEIEVIKKANDKHNTLENLKRLYKNGVYWQDIANNHLTGRTITESWWQEWDDSDSNTGLMLKLDNDTIIWVQQDDEGNGPGALYLQWQQEVGDIKTETLGTGFSSQTLPVGPTSKKETAWAKERLEAINEEV